MSRFFQGKPSAPAAPAPQAGPHPGPAPAAAAEKMRDMTAPPGPDLARAELRMRTLEVAGVFRVQNTPVETLLKTADQLFAWVTEQSPQHNPGA